MTTATWFLVTESFIPGFNVFWRSLLQHNPRRLFGDVVIQTNVPEQFIGTGFRLWPYNPDRYTDWPTLGPRITPCYAKLEALECSDYDRILMFDSDMICTGSIAEIFERPEPWVSVGVQDTTKNPRRRFNGGLWLARRPAIDCPGAIDQLDVAARTGQLFDQCDQSALLLHLENLGIEPYLLPSRYNLQTAFAQHHELRAIYQAEVYDCRILHLTGDRKPWESKPPHMGWRERFRPLWDRAANGEKLIAADVVAVNVID